MKKLKFILATTIAIALAATGAFARDIKSGTFEVGGSTAIGYSSNSVDYGKAGDNDFTETKIKADASYYLVNNISVGGFVDYHKLDYDNGGDTIDFTIGPQATYQLPLNENVNLLAMGALGYVSSELDAEDTTIDGTGWGVALGGGLAYFPTDWLSINGLIKYQYTEIDYDDIDITAKADTFGMDIGLSFYFK